MNEFITTLVLLFGPIPANPAAELSRFPDGATTSALLVFNAAYRQNLQFDRGVFPHHWEAWGEEAWREAAWQYNAWNALDWAHKINDQDSRRGWLAELRRQIGDDAYFSGRMPAPVPFEYFTEIGPLR